MKNYLILAVFTGFVAICVNDVGRYASSLWQLDTMTKEVAQIASEAARAERGESQAGGRVAVQAAQERGFIVYGYDSDEESVRVWTQDVVEGTWVAGPLLAWTAGEPLDSPIEITRQNEAPIR